MFCNVDTATLTPKHDSLFSRSVLGVYEHIKHQPSAASDQEQTYPYFDMDPPGSQNHLRGVNVTGFTEQSTHLHCVVRDIGDRMVSIYHLLLIVPTIE